jgi:hypothetical protein|tara:strand:- start:1122 stop:1544 length:423 start_codon:yes stop_codon:yes gene_type:complete
MTITTIVTSQAPDAKPVAKSFTLTTNWQTMIEVPNYEVPELVFGGSTTVEPGVGEVISPLILCNFTANTVAVDVRTHREDVNAEFWIIRNLQIPAYDTIPLPLNGQFFKSGDLLEIKCDTNLAVDASLSFTLGQSEEDDV